MNIKQREEIIEEEFNNVEDLLNKKGRDYSGEKDALANFKNSRVGNTKYQSWAELLNKHVDAVNNAVKRNPEFPERYSESIKESLRDIIGYAVLGICLVSEDEEQKGPTVVSDDDCDDT